MAKVKKSYLFVLNYQEPEIEEDVIAFLDKWKPPSGGEPAAKK